VFKILSGPQKGRLVQLVHSPFFNKKPDVTALHDFIRRYSPTYDHTRLEKKQTIKYLKTANPLNERKLGYLMNDLLKLTERYLAIEKLEEDGFQSNLYVAGQYKLLGLKRHYNYALARSQKMIDERPFKVADDYYKLFVLQDISNVDRDKKEDRVTDAGFETAEKYLDAYYLGQKLRYAAENVNRRSIVQKFTPSAIIEEVSGYLKKSIETQEPVVRMGYTIFQMLNEPDDESHYQKLKILSAQLSNVLPIREAQELQTLMINYTVKMINRGSTDYLQEYYSLNKQLIEQDRFIKEEPLSVFRYNNMVHCGIRLNDLDWVERFIYDFKDGFSESSFNYNLAHLYFAKKDLENAQSALAITNYIFPDIHEMIAAKILLTKIYYETKEFDLLPDHLNSFWVFIKRNKKFPNEKRQVVSDFLNNVKKLYKTPRWENDTLKLLKNKIESIEHVVEKQWVLEKVNEKLTG
jgi:hypothetical protein